MPRSCDDGHAGISFLFIRISVLSELDWLDLVRKWHRPEAARRRRRTWDCPNTRKRWALFRLLCSCRILESNEAPARYLRPSVSKICYINKIRPTCLSFCRRRFIKRFVVGVGETTGNELSRADCLLLIKMTGIRIRCGVSECRRKSTFWFTHREAPLSFFRMRRKIEENSIR